MEKHVKKHLLPYTATGLCYEAKAPQKQTRARLRSYVDAHPYNQHVYARYQDIIDKSSDFVRLCMLDAFTEAFYAASTGARSSSLFDIDPGNTPVPPNPLLWGCLTQYTSFNYSGHPPLEGRWETRLPGISADILTFLEKVDDPAAHNGPGDGL